ncbi:MAG: YceI family protein [Actinobacteria bacterium]|nr:YceI family protein [Actinomycetota bacterium]
MSKKWIIAIVAAVVVVAAGFTVWYLVFRDDSPAAVSIDRATDALDQSSGKGSGKGSGSSSSSSKSSSLDGTWTVDDSIGSFSDFTSSFAGFRVQEELASIGAKTAVGRTPDVTGGISIDGTTITEASFEVDMTTLTTDSGLRDNAIRNQAIETSRFPTAIFKTTKPIDLGAIPAEGQEITVDATGDLTLHGVTKSVTIPLTAKRQGDVIAVVGSLEIPFADYSINKPSSVAVLSVEDKGVMEVQLFLTRTS